MKLLISFIGNLFDHATDSVTEPTSGTIEADYKNLVPIEELVSSAMDTDTTSVVDITITNITTL